MDLITFEEAKAAVQKWGAKRQTEMMIEEIGEFLAAWNHYKRGRISYDDYVAEIADMFIMIQQQIYIHMDKFTEMYPKKLAKVRNKLDKLNPKTIEEIVDTVVEQNSPGLFKAVKDRRKNDKNL